MRITIHQPEHLPWLGFLAKINAADVWVVLDHVSYRKNYFQNRNRVSNRGEDSWLTVPVSAKMETPISQVRIAETPGWQRKYLGRLDQALKIDVHTDSRFAGMASSIANAKPGDLLADLNMELIEWMRGHFGIDTPVVLSSELGIKTAKSDLILDICNALSATQYIAGPSGRDYLVPGDFDNSGIEVRFFDFHHPVYDKTPPPFVPGMSAADALANVPAEQLQNLINDFELAVT